MRFVGRPKVLLHSEMDSEIAFLEPHSAAPCQIRRLLYFRNPQHAGIKTSRVVFTSGRHRELYVMDSNDRAFVHRSNAIKIMLKGSELARRSRKVCRCLGILCRRLGIFARAPLKIPRAWQSLPEA